MLHVIFTGYNATILAYGQTGSGKTYTMGTNYESSNAAPDLSGIIPRAVQLLFDTVEERAEAETVTASVSFIEVGITGCFSVISRSLFCR